MAANHKTSMRPHAGFKGVSAGQSPGYRQSTHDGTGLGGYGNPDHGKVTPPATAGQGQFKAGGKAPNPARMGNPDHGNVRPSGMVAMAGGGKVKKDKC